MQPGLVADPKLCLDIRRWSVIDNDNGRFGCATERVARLGLD